MDPVEKTPQNPRFEAGIAPICSMRKKLAVAGKKEDGTRDSVESMWQQKKDPLHYNSLRDRNSNSYLTTPTVMQHLIQQGLVSTVNAIFICTKDY